MAKQINKEESIFDTHENLIQESTFGAGDTPTFEDDSTPTIESINYEDVTAAGFIKTVFNGSANFLNEIFDNAKSGHTDILDAYLFFNELEKMVVKFKEELKEQTVREIEKYGKEGVVKRNVTLTVSQKTTWSGHDTQYDSYLRELLDKEAATKKEIARRKNIMEKLAANPFENGIVDEDTGEVVERKITIVNEETGQEEVINRILPTQKTTVFPVASKTGKSWKDKKKQ